jgi:hypothetical protein
MQWVGGKFNFTGWRHFYEIGANTDDMTRTGVRSGNVISRHFQRRDLSLGGPVIRSS